MEILPETMIQFQLLMNAVGNVIDDNKNVEHITYLEIWEWMNEILGEIQ